MTDTLEKIIEAINNGFGTLANSITPIDAIPSQDATGGSVASLTESIMGVTSGLAMIAEAINNLAESLRE